MPDRIYTTKDNDMLDMIIHKYYGNEAVATGSAVEYVLQLNQNLSRNGVFLTAGQKILLPELSEDILSGSKQVAIFNE